MVETKYGLLGLLTREPNYGYELKKLYDNYFAGDKPILAGQVYSTLARLARDAKVMEVADSGAPAGPARTRYAVTAGGEKELVEWLRTPLIPSPTLQSELYLKTVLALLINGDAALYLKAQRQAHQQRMRELTARKQHASLAEKLLLDQAIFHIDADLRWISLTTSRLDALKEQL
ncbi:PadR family transcriptional regulator [Mobiluncus curtisii]|uniref:Transcriptional regulator, PadR family n=1 Tax=Mobiluncus curtisii (strain ATCC 43063 / DSM 2711 / V125) TaxID=548479 RepID=D6ZJU6_MOBCV|nr:helix-turn-helix transcriptional regulator [Mobiluncus curtisii]ADI66995.1 transcriptional regulator, PadR family [Mobiluncus curtisii ATCC 43063]QQU09212.1 helix-turn-helix transcriptional regulator [Mobiluncus curtisii]